MGSLSLDLRAGLKKRPSFPKQSNQVLQYWPSMELQGPQVLALLQVVKSQIPGNQPTTRPYTVE